MTKKSGIIAFIAIIVLILTGCSSIIIIRTQSNMLSVRPGGTLNLTVSGARNYIWIVSSTRDGNGSVAGGTYISNGVLYVDVNERVNILVSVIST